MKAIEQSFPETMRVRETVGEKGKRLLPEVRWDLCQEDGWSQENNVTQLSSSRRPNEDVSIPTFTPYTPFQVGLNHKF